MNYALQCAWNIHEQNNGVCNFFGLVIPTYAIFIKKKKLNKNNPHPHQI